MIKKIVSDPRDLVLAKPGNNATFQVHNLYSRTKRLDSGDRTQYPETLPKLVRRNSMNAIAEAPMPMEMTFSDIYEEHHRKVFNLCAYLLNSRTAAEDATHEVFMRAHRKLDTYNPAFSFSNWILKVASNYCVDVLRRRQREKRLFGADASIIPEPSSNQQSPLGEVISSERNRKIRRALASLPEKFRIPLILAYYNEFSYDEIAAVLDIPRNTVATLLFRGKQQLREKLRKEQHDEMSH